MSILKCKQKLCGFPEDKCSNKGKVLIPDFHKKNCLRWFEKRQSRLENDNLWIAYWDREVDFERQAVCYVTEECYIKAIYQGNILLFKVNVIKFQSGGWHTSMLIRTLLIVKMTAEKLLICNLLYYFFW